MNVKEKTGKGSESQKMEGTYLLPATLERW